MIQLCDRRAACLLLQYTGGLISSTSISTLPSQAAALIDASLVLSTQLLSLPSFQLYPQHQQHQPLEKTAATTTTVTTKELARFIATNTPKEFLWAVKQSGGKFLYRGEEPNSNAATLLFWIQNPKKHSGSNADDDPHFFVVRTCNPAPDLLLPETYGYDPLALRYFEELEAFLSSSSSSVSATPNANVDVAATPHSSTKIIAKPSNGHIATSDALEAGKWGKIVSTWPLLPSTIESSINPNNINNNNNSAIFSYVWPRNRSVFYESSSSSSSSSNNDTSTTTKTIQNNNLLVVNEKLQDALTAKGGREVLFAFAPSSTTIAATASAAFLAIPGELDVALRDELERIDYGL